VHNGEIYNYQELRGLLSKDHTIEDEDFNEAVTLYDAALKDTVKRMLRGLSVDKVGMIFSGGEDSVLIAKLISDFRWNLNCYCVGNENFTQT
jgi:asparagine synthetase B (glutamine-hydrolysing)